MWFKNLRLYRFSDNVDILAEDLETALNTDPFIPCGRHEPSRSGWVPPLGEASTNLVHSADGCLLVCLKHEEKILPTAVIRDKVDQAVQQIEDRESRKVYRKEKDSIKDDVLHDCLPQAFTRSHRHFAYIDTRQGWLCIDNATSGKAEALIKKMREALGSLPVIPIQVNDSPAVIMSQWLIDDHLPEGITLEHECELKEPGEEGSILRCKHQDLLSEEIKQHLDAGKKVTRVALDWRNHMKLILQEDLVLKRLKFSEQLVNEAQEDADGDEISQADADFALMTSTLKQFIPELLNCFGDIKKDSAI